MKKVVFLIITLFLLVCSLSAQGDGVVVFNETVHDFGEISERGGKVSCEFILTNNTKEPLLIRRATASCGCTTPTWTKEPIEPGKTGTIVAVFDPKNNPGAFNKTVTVYTNENNKTYRLFIKGNVLKGEVDKKAGYTEQMGTLLMKKKSLSFGRIMPDAKSTIHLEFFNDSDSPFTFRFKDLPPYLTVEANAKSIPARSAGLLKVELDAAVAGYGTQEGTFAIYSGNIPYELFYKFKIEDNFSKLTKEERENAGKINLSVSELNFDDLKSKDKVLKFSNSGKTDLHVKMIQSSDPLVTVSSKSLTIKPNEIKEIKVVLDRGKAKAGFTASLTIYSDDPNNSEKIIAIKTTL